MPITTLSSLNTSSIGKPDISFTANKLPLSESATPRSTPFDPINATLPSANTSSLILLEALPLNVIYGFIPLPGVPRLIYEADIVGTTTELDTDRLPVINTLPLTSNATDGFIFLIPTNDPELYIDPVVNVVALSNIAA